MRARFSHHVIDRARLSVSGVRMLVLGIVLSLAVACSRSSGPSTPGGASPAEGPVRPPGSAVWSGAPLRGNSTEALRTYLSTVEEIKPKRFEVQWNPATVAIDKAAALRSLRAVSRDGAIFTFASDEPALTKLKPGSILWVWDVAVRKVDSIETFGAVTHVQTSVVKLTEAMPNARIEFETPLKLQNYFPQRKVEPPESVTAHRGLRAPGLMYVMLTEPAPGEQPGGADDPTTLPPENLQDPDSPQDSDDDDWYEEGMSSNGFNGTKNGWAYSVGYRVRPGGITIELQARKGDLEGGTASGQHSLIPEYKAIEKDRQEIHKAIGQAEQEIKEEEKGVTQTDQEFEQQMKQLLNDQADRKDPNYSGPTLPPQVNKYGEPITDKAAQQLLKDKWQKKHDVEIQKLQAKEQILGEWRIKKDQLEARKRALKVAKGVAAQLFQIADDNFDARLRGRVDLDGFAIGEELGFVNGDIDVAATHFRNLNGKVQAQLIGRLGKPGNDATKIPIMHVPVSFNVPIPVGGVPFVVQLGSDFLITLSLSGMHASLSMDGQVAFKGDSGLTYAKGKANYDSSFSTSGDPEITNHQGMSPGVSAVVLAVQMPRVGLGLGVFGVSSVAYMDVVNVLTMTQAGAVGAGLLPQCKRMTYNAVGHVGVETNVIPLPFVDTSSVAGALTTKKEIFNNTKVKLDPAVKGCEI
jgi:hypothetical protein